MDDSNTKNSEGNVGNREEEVKDEGGLKAPKVETNTTDWERAGPSTVPPPANDRKPDPPENRAAFPSFRFMRIKKRLGICAAEHPHVVLSNTQVESISKRLLEIVLSPEGRRVKPRFFGMRVLPGQLVLVCGDDTTVSWVKTLPQKLAEYRLKVVEDTADVKSFIAVGHFRKSEGESNARILGFLESQNEGLNCSRWKVLDKTHEKKGAVRMTFSLDWASAEVLKAKGPMLNYKFGGARFMLKTKRGIKFKEEEWDEDEDDDDMEVWEDFQTGAGLPNPFSQAEPRPGEFFQPPAGENVPYTVPRRFGDYEARIARVVEKSKNALRHGLTSRERYLSGMRRAKKGRKKRKNRNKGKAEPG